MKSINLSNVIILTAAVTAFVSSAFASNITNVQSTRAVNQWQDLTSIHSTKTRAEVRYELNRAESKGISEQHEFVEFPTKSVPSTSTRAQVQSEIDQSSAKKTLSPSNIYYGG